MKSKWRNGIGSFLLASVLIVAGCGSNNNSANSTSPSSTSPSSTSPSSTSSESPSADAKAKPVQGGPLEVGVLWPEGSDNFVAAQRVGDSLTTEFPGTDLTFTFSNTKARPQLELRWKNDDPLDVDNIFNGANKSSYHWVDEGKLKKLTDTLKNTTRPDYDGKSWEESILPIFRPFTQYKGDYYSVPDQAVVIGLWYNKKMFDEFGLAPPTTWDEFLKVSEALKAKQVDPIAVAGTSPLYMGMWWDYLLQREVGTQGVMDVAFGDKKAADNPGFLKAAQKLQQLVDNGNFLKGFEGLDFTAAQTEFFRGKTGMILMGSWLVGEMKQSIPADFQVGITSFPAVPEGQGDQKGMFGTVFQWSIAEKSKNPDLAVEYLRTLTSKQEQTQRAHDLGFISPYAGVPTPDSIPGLDGVLKNAENSPLTLNYYGINTDKQRSDSWYLPVSKLYFKQATPEEVIKEIDDNLARLRQK
ncbi:extracellular solute-binding protein [Paenibacillus solisilvae]|uniref:Probable sugar-binding periplasmic protein n=1 Tax=Paenibacillus solisilvae TaxID=2486751 RepID=A0ABW0VXH9_9BACL